MCINALDFGKSLLKMSIYSCHGHFKTIWRMDPKDSNFGEPHIWVVGFRFPEHILMKPKFGENKIGGFRPCVIHMMH